VLLNRTRTIIAAVAVLIAVLLGFLLFWPVEQTETTTAAVQAVPAETPAAPETAAQPETPAETATAAAPSEPAKQAEPMASAEPTQQAAPAPAATTAAPAPATAEAPATAPAPSSTQMATLVPPAFDVVRVEPNGEAVIAGRAMAGSQVTVLDGSISLGGVAADGRGQWVFVVDPPLTPGGHELSLEARLADGRVVASTDVVVVNVPLPQIAVAPQASPEPSTTTTADASSAVTGSGTKLSPEAATAEKPLAVLMPRTGQGTSQVLQQSVSRQDGLAKGTLILESIDYDERGAIIGGRAEPGTRLIVYLDDAALGETTAGADGRWNLVLDRPLETGLHRLRVDAVDGQGTVIARVETPFSRASLAEALPDETSVIVQPGNSLWRIARRVYGEGIRYALIFEANQEQIRNPDLIYPGQIFKMPMTTPAAAPTN
jgi:nucleoid-associated protein YgaU